MPASPSQAATAREQQQPWGVDKAEDFWDGLKKQLQMQKVAQEARFAAAKELPGVREFVRPHEMNTQVNNWDRQLDNVTLKVDKVRRQAGPLGVRAELAKDELRAVFPIIQRLQWTRWTASEIFWHAFVRARPSQGIFLNIATPSKRHRCYLNGLFLIMTLLGCTVMLAFEAPVREDIDAAGRATWTLLAEVFTMPWQIATLPVAAIADVLARAIRGGCYRVFFACNISMARPLLSSDGARKEQLHYWHELAQMGFVVCCVCIAVGLAGALALCAVMPQPRTAAVLRAYLVALWLSHLLYPLCSAFFAGTVLLLARSGPMFDGLLSAFPGIMDFLSVGVKTPEFLAWRTQRIVSELEMLRQVYNDRPGRSQREPTKVEHLSTGARLRQAAGQDLQAMQFDAQPPEQFPQEDALALGDAGAGQALAVAQDPGHSEAPAFSGAEAEAQ